MTNHLRTLLLNQDGATAPDPSYPAEEYVPPSYRAKSLRGYLKQIHQLVFSADPERIFLNIRLRALLGMIHASELDDYVRQLDPRITYLPFSDDLFNYLAANPPVRPTIGVAQLAELITYGLTDAMSAQLFSATEPYKTFRNLWMQHDQLPYRLGGLVLALGYRIDEQQG